MLRRIFQESVSCDFVNYCMVYKSQKTQITKIVGMKILLITLKLLFKITVYNLLELAETLNCGFPLSVIITLPETTYCNIFYLVCNNQLIYELHFQK